MSNPDNPHPHHERPGPALRSLGAEVLQRFGLDADDERLAGAFEVALEATRRRLADLGVSEPRAASEELAACRILAPLFAAAHEEAIQKVLSDTSPSQRKAIVVEVDRVLQPAVDAPDEWSWVDPRRWRYHLASGRDAYDHGLLLASRAGCVVFFQDKRLAEHEYSPLGFAERVGELQRQPGSDAGLLDLIRSSVPVQWN